MSTVFEPRFTHDAASQAFYPSLDDDHHDATADSERFADPTDSVVENLASIASFNAPTTPFVDTTEHRLDDTRLEDHRLEEPRLEDLASPPKEDSPTATTPQRIKAIPKPDRTVVKNAEGKYVCSWPDCTEETKEFNRKCEWNKHMDKHDRPYKCAAEGCEKLPGFTYSGGLLRHEREVHGKHGGPKNSFNCPHPNCKRHTGKGFSRLENLNEHLRRVHTQNGVPTNGTVAEVETDDAASDTAVAGQKRKRDSDESSGIAELREELKRVRQENEELRRQVNAQNQQTVMMMQRITELTGGDIARMAVAAVSAPAAQMTTTTMI
ncbi:cell wall transcription factor ACE2 [Rhypophila decipiens]|uniref:Cell wall transcription factor ACE2 n=1 Tax=Rhypophila decipiens TaxID=261697 RepID=A0AAN6Y2Y9_9PEZI|nr:cell wall transcription factor ACE2 [Rhypophila decipiens]